MVESASSHRHMGERPNSRWWSLFWAATTLLLALLARASFGAVPIFESGTPVQLEDRYVVPEFAPGFLDTDFTTTTPSAYLSSISPLQEAEHVVRATMPDAETCRHLGMQEGEPCLVVTRRTWAHGRPVTFARLCHPG